MKPLICFVDDSGFELENFKKNAAWAFSKVDFIYAKTFEQAVSQVNNKVVIGFLLDIYGKIPSGKPPSGFDRKRYFSEAPQAFDPVELVRNNFPKDSEQVNGFLRGLYNQVQSWQVFFNRTAGDLGQSRAYGLANLEKASQKYPWAASLAYSRKALYLDGVKMSRAGAMMVLQKPQGLDDADIARKTRKAGPDLAHALYQAVNRRLIAKASPLGLRLALLGEEKYTILAQAVNRGINRLADPLQSRVNVKAADLARELEKAQDAPVLEPIERKILLALQTWLAQQDIAPD
ncbi:hypothetical protein [Dethiosulfatarculus sandiegensis]|uniref:DUF3800 domain-containing protein n=1 Tax=Dethiosulfatarculus sandiegensis TaxID=1429043 RepID=A0A0D2GAN9_9BACT|nr:hypothetical protein [Dethiosulfatarculus sandiegensis]KIX11932.1 hypothetical protein X474_21620 [Dethiosulfatarculus sandiegensis]